jgi:putative oxidoreductase
MRGEETMADLGYALGRIAMSIVFVFFGYLQATNIAGYVKNAGIVKFVADTGNVFPPTAVAWTVAGVDLVGGLMVLFGLKTRFAAAVLFVFVALTIWYAHPFWTMTGAARGANQAHALKNLAIMGALLLLMVHGSGRYSIDGMRGGRGG